jgi:hypothetical protein
MALEGREISITEQLATHLVNLKEQINEQQHKIDSHNDLRPVTDEHEKNLQTGFLIEFEKWWKVAGQLSEEMDKLQEEFKVCEQNLTEYMAPHEGKYIEVSDPTGSKIFRLSVIEDGHPIMKKKTVRMTQTY